MLFYQNKNGENLDDNSHTIEFGSSKTKKSVRRGYTEILSVNKSERIDTNFCISSREGEEEDCKSARKKWKRRGNKFDQNSSKCCEMA